MLYRYYFLNRPPMYATLEPGFINYEQWHPAKAPPEFPARHMHGWADYPVPLTKEQVWKWELLPASRKEYIEYFFWRDNGKDDNAARDAINEYLELDDVSLSVLINDAQSYEASLAMEYKHNGGAYD